MGSLDSQPTLFDGPDRTADVRKLLIALNRDSIQPPARELVEIVDRELGLKARWDLEAAITGLIVPGATTRLHGDYLRWVLDELRSDRTEAEASAREAKSSIDLLFEQSRWY